MEKVQSHYSNIVRPNTVCVMQVSVPRFSAGLAIKAWLFVALEYCGHATPVVEKKICLHETNPFCKRCFLYYSTCIAFLEWDLKIANKPIFMFEFSVFIWKHSFFFFKDVFCKIKKKENTSSFKT